MGFKEAISTVFGKYAVISGRARRSEFWFWALFVWLSSLAISIVEHVIGIGQPMGGGPLSALLSLALLLPNICVGGRRLHDTGKSAWWLLIALVPVIGIIVLIVFFTQKSDVGDNAYGPDPLAGERS